MSSLYSLDTTASDANMDVAVRSLTSSSHIREKHVQTHALFGPGAWVVRVSQSTDLPHIKKRVPVYFPLDAITSTINDVDLYKIVEQTSEKLVVCVVICDYIKTSSMTLMLGNTFSYVSFLC